MSLSLRYDYLLPDEEAKAALKAELDAGKHAYEAVQEQKRAGRMGFARLPYQTDGDLAPLLELADAVRSEFGQVIIVGIGGSLLSIGSAAGVALMGIGRQSYTFTSHIKWSWAILLGFIGAVAAHLLLNSGSFAQ